MNGRIPAQTASPRLQNVQEVMQNPAQNAAMKRSAIAAKSQVSIERTVQETLEFYQRIRSQPVPATLPQ